MDGPLTQSRSELARSYEEKFSNELFEVTLKCFLLKTKGSSRSFL
jgi:hypothetical protein